MANRIKLIFEAVNNVSDSIADIKKDLDGLENITEIFGKESFGGLVSGIVSVAQEVVGALDEFGREAASFTALRDSYSDLVENIGLDSEQLLADMKRASGGMISESELMLSANKAVLLGVADTSEEIQNLLQISIARGRAFGLSASEAFDDIVTGLGRLSPLILDNLGIVVNTQATYEKYAATIGKTAQSLTDLEKKEALVAEVTRVSGSIVASNEKLYNSAQAAVDRYDSAVQDLRLTLSALVTDDYIKGYASWAEAIETVTATLKGQRTGITEYLEQLNRMILYQNLGVETGGQVADSLERSAAATELARTHTDRHATILKMKAQTDRDAAEATAAHAANLALFESALGQTGSEMSTFAALAHSAGVEMANLDEYVKQVKQSMGNFTSQFDQINSLSRSAANQVLGAAKRALPELGKDEALRILNQQLATIEGTTEGLKYQNLTAAELNLTYAEMAETLSSPFNDAIESAKDGQKAWNDSVKAGEQAYEKLRSQVESVLSGFLDPGVGVNPDEILEKLGLRQDSVNENARRLADVAVKGWESPWAQYLKDEFPELIGAAFEDGDIRAKAAELLKDFQDGLRPELLDKEKAKERVRRMLIGEQRMKELAEEITAELNEELGGVGIANIGAAARQALGVSGSEGDGGRTSGAAFGEGILDYVKGEDVGTQVVTVVAAQIITEGNLSRTYEAGKQHGSSWGQGFLNDVGDNVPVELIEILAKLVTPSVQNNLNTQTTLTGAN